VTFKGRDNPGAIAFSGSIRIENADDAGDDSRRSVSDFFEVLRRDNVRVCGVPSVTLEKITSLGKIEMGSDVDWDNVDRGRDDNEAERGFLDAELDAD